MVSTHKTDWDLKLPSAVHAYNTSKKVTTGKSPYFLVFGQTALHGIEMEIETYRIIAARTRTRNLDLTTKLLAIEDLEEAKEEALTRTTEIQAKRKEDFDEKLLESHGIKKGGLVLSYDNRHKEFPGKLHTRWMGPYNVTQIYSNGFLQLEDIQGVWLDTRVNESRVKKYKEESASKDELGQP